MFLVYKTDNWHSYRSRDLIGVCTSFNIAFKICLQQAKKEGEKISEDDIYNLRNIKQTQDYTGEGEFVIEEIDKNILL